MKIALNCHPLKAVLMSASIALAWQGCMNEPKPTSPPAPPVPAPLPNSPEGVVRRWQVLLDSNRFEEARQLGTERTQQWINTTFDSTYQDMIRKDPGGQDLSLTVFDTLYCIEKGDKASCIYLIRIENEETIRDSFELIRQNGQWLIDINDIPDDQQELFDDHDQDAQAEAPAKKPAKKKK